MSLSNTYNISEALLREKPKKGITLQIKDGAIKSRMLEKASVTLDKLGEDVKDYIDSLLTVSSQENYMGIWNPAVQYTNTPNTYTTVTHLGCKWYLTDQSSIGDEPLPFSEVWEVMQGNSKISLFFTNDSNFIIYVKNVHTIVSLHLLFNDYDITHKMLDKAYSMSWVRDSGVSADDKAWKPTFVNGNGEIIQADKIEERTHLLLRQNEEVKDLGMKWNEVRTCRFVVTIELDNDVSLTGEIII